MKFLLKVSLLAARNERESVQIALRPKVSWGGPGIAGAVQIHCSDLCSPSGDRLGTSPPFRVSSLSLAYLRYFALIV